MSDNRISPKIADYEVGATVKFQCLSLKKPFMNSTVNWFFNDGFIKHYAISQGARSQDLIIKNVDVVHNGFYTCHGIKMKGPKYIRFLSTAKLRVFGKL